ncbi:Vacuolar import and degradation protein 27 [Dictyocoela muelleri]|nr:Vacuolar import and degradation protein 27 [Dictyocoela muelleri]
MFQKLFSFLSKNKKADLSINKKLISKNEPVSIEDNKLKIGKRLLNVEMIHDMEIFYKDTEKLNETEDKKFKDGDLKDINNLNSLPELYFQYNDDLYLLKGDISEIYISLKPLIKDSFFIFKGKGIYFIYDKSFKEIGKSELKIIKEDGFYYLKITCIKDENPKVENQKVENPKVENNYCINNDYINDDCMNNESYNKNYMHKDKTNDRRTDNIFPEIIHFEPINPDIDFYSDRNNRSFVWASKSNNQINTFSFVFNENNEFLEFLSKFLTAIRGEDDGYFEKMEIENYNYQDREEGHDSDEEGYEENYYENYEEEDYAEDYDEGYDDEDYETNLKKFNNDDNFNNDDKNSLLVTDKNRAYITRGSSLGVFSTENELKFKTRIKSIDKNLKKIIPNNDNLILLNTDEDKLKILNLERGEVVENWDIKRPINDFFGDKKYYKEVLVGINENELFRIDKRVKEKVVSGKNHRNNYKENVKNDLNVKNSGDFKDKNLKDTEELSKFKEVTHYNDLITDSKHYKTKVDFKFGQSTETGNIVIVNSKGDLRLYDKIGKNAKTLIPGFRNEIRGIDVSDNGKFVVVTSKNVILFYVVNEDYSKRTNYDFKKNKLNINDNIKSGEIPVFKRLQLKPEHLAFINEEVSFTPAHFEKNHILTSTGKYIIFWNIDEILKGNLFSYQIKKYNSNIVADSFRFGDDNEIIVALPDDVKMIRKDKLVKGDKVFRYKRE